MRWLWGVGLALRDNDDIAAFKVQLITIEEYQAFTIDKCQYFITAGVAMVIRSYLKEVLFTLKANVLGITGKVYVAMKSVWL